MNRAGTSWTLELDDRDHWTGLASGLWETARASLRPKQRGGNHARDVRRRRELLLGEVEHLSSNVIPGHVWHQSCAAFVAAREVMIDDEVGLGDLPQGLAFAALLPARLTGRLLY